MTTYPFTAFGGQDAEQFERETGAEISVLPGNIKLDEFRWQLRGHIDGDTEEEALENVDELLSEVMLSADQYGVDLRW